MTRRAPKAEQYGRTLLRRPELEADAIAQRRHTTPPYEVWASRYYLVQIFPVIPGTERITVNRTTFAPKGNRWADGITWDDLQQIKADVGRGDRWALEVYPPDVHVVNVANMRHLFVVAERPWFAWENPT